MCEHIYGRETFTICTNEQKFITKMANLAKKHPDDVKLVSKDEFTQSVIYHVPESWVVVRKPRRMNYSEEYRQTLAERARARNVRGS